MHRDWFEFYPVLKLFVAVNHKPTIRGGDHGIWRRIQLWPFEVTIPDEEQDQNLGERLIAEGPGILAWALRGCLEWQRRGLAPPDSVRVATADYRTEMDTVGRFLDERCVVGPTYSATARALYDAYKAWCAEQGEHEQSQTRLGLSLRERGLRKAKAAADVVWHGVGLAVRGAPSAPG
jgi:putative DNA primase/helicase